MSKATTSGMGKGGLLLRLILSILLVFSLLGTVGSAVGVSVPLKNSGVPTRYCSKGFVQSLSSFARRLSSVTDIFAATFSSPLSG